MGQNLGDAAWIFNIDVKYIFQLFMALLLGYDNDQIREVILQVIQSIVQDVCGDHNEAEEDKKNLEDKEGGEEEHTSVELLTNAMLALCCITKGTNFDIEKLSKKYEDFKNVSKFELFYKACKGDVMSIKPILDGLRLSQHKKILIEFCHLLKGEEITLEEIPGRIGLIPEHFSLFTNLFNFMITCSKYAIIEGNTSSEELKKEKELYKNKIISKLVDMHLCMTKGGNTKPAIDFKTMSLRIDRIFNAKSRKVIKELKKKWNKTTDIDDEVFLVLANKIIDDIRSVRDDNTYQDIIEQLVDFLNIKEEKKRLIVAACDLTLRFISNINVFDQNDNEALKKDLERVSILLGIKEEYLTFILAIMTGNPYIVFGCKDANPNIDLDNLKISATMQETNLIIIAEALGISYIETKKLGALWIYHFNNLNQGERYIPKLASLIGVDAQYLYLISKFV